MALTAIACANKKEDPTKLAVTNSNSGTVTSVTVTSASDSSKTATFTSLTGGGATTASQEISFSGTVNVVCNPVGTGGCTSGSVSLSANQSNTIIINGGAPTTGTPTSSGGSGW